MSECESKICKEGKCTHLLDGDVCNENDNCGLNSFCMEHGAGNYRTCTALKKEGEECGTDDYCGFNMACGTVEDSKKKCPIMFSLDAGKMCDNNLLCKSGFATKKLETDKTLYCADYKMLNTTCELGNKCDMTIQFGNDEKRDYQDECRCKWDGKSLCRLDSSSGQWTNFTKIYDEQIKALTKEETEKIHVVLERGKWWGIPKIQNAYAEYGQYFEIDGTEDCVKSFYLSNSYTKYSFLGLGLVSLFYLLL